MNYVLFLSEESRSLAVLDESTLRQRLRSGQIREDDDVYLPDTKQHFKAGELLRVIRHLPKPSELGAVPRPTAQPKGQVQPTVPAAPVQPRAKTPPTPPSLEPALHKPVLTVAQVPASEYYQEADHLLEAYAKRYRVAERDLTRAVLCIPLLGYGFFSLFRAMNERNAVLRRVRQAGFVDETLYTVLRTGSKTPLIAGRRREQVTLIAATLAVGSGLLGCVVFGVRAAVYRLLHGPMSVAASRTSEVATTSIPRR